MLRLLVLPPRFKGMGHIRAAVGKKLNQNDVFPLLNCHLIFYLSILKKKNDFGKDLAFILFYFNNFEERLLWSSVDGE
jgi:hypothetical protein